MAKKSVKNFLLSKVVALGCALLSLILLVSSTITHVTESKLGEAEAEYNAWDLVTNNVEVGKAPLKVELDFSEYTARTFMLIATILIAVVVVYFAVSLVLTMLRVKHPLGKYEKIVSVVLVVGVLVWGLAQLFPYEHKDNLINVTETFKTMNLLWGLALASSIGAVAAKVALTK